MIQDELFNDNASVHCTARYKYIVLRDRDQPPAELESRFSWLKRIEMDWSDAVCIVSENQLKDFVSNTYLPTYSVTYSHV